MTLKKSSEELGLIPLSNIIALIKKNKKSILLCMAICASLAFFYRVNQPIIYESVGTFKDKANNTEGLSKSISSVLLLKDPAGSEVMTLMKSRLLAEKLVLENGLQAHIQLVQRHPLKFLHKLKDNILAEYAVLKNQKSPILNDEPIDLQIKNVVYTSEVPLKLFLKVNTEDSYTLFDDNHVKIGDGNFGIPFVSDTFEINPLLVGKSDQVIQNEYSIELMPLGMTAKKIMNQFNIQMSLNDKGLVKITYKNPNRHLSSHHIKELIRIYLSYINKEHQHFVNMQMDYLQNRQTILSQQIEKDLQVYANTLTSDLTATGFTTSSQALQFFAENQQQLKQKLFSVEIDRQRLEKIHNEKGADFDKFAFIPASAGIDKFVHEMHALRQQADAIKNTLLRSSKSNQPMKKSTFSDEFQGINLGTAKELYINYSKELNNTESQAIQERYIIQQMDESTFDVSSLSSTLHDPVSAEIIAQTSKLVLALRDGNNLSTKEQERIKGELALQKGFLKSHLEQNVAILELRKNYLRNKIHLLQTVTLALTNEQIAILENQIKQFVLHADASLKDEQVILKRHLSELNIDMAMFPQKWVAEKLIEQKMETNQHLMEEMVKLVETKNVSDNLDLIKSTPIDSPLIPIQPQPPYLILFSILGALLGGFFSISWFIVKTIKSGIEASPDALRLIGQHVSGTIIGRDKGKSTPLLDSDLETLRSLLSYFTNNDDQTKANDDSFIGKTLLVLKNHSANYVDELTELMLLKGLKVLKVNLCFDQLQIDHDTKKTGLLQYLEGNLNDIEIVHTPFHDKINSGGFSRHANELICSRRFIELIKQLQANYDWIIAYSNAKPSSAEAKNLLDLFPCAAITIKDESLSQLETCISRTEKPNVLISYLHSSNNGCLE